MHTLCVCMSVCVYGACVCVHVCVCDREHGRDPQKASPQVAGTCSKDGRQQNAQATPVWRA